MFLDDIKALKTGKTELRKFGLTVGGVFLLLGVIMLLRHKPHYPWFFWPGVALVLLGAAIPSVLKPVYLAWMTLGHALGFVVSNVLLTVFFFLVMTSIGLIARLSGKDFLRLKLDRNAATYWLPRSKTPKPAQDYEKQF